MFGNLKTIKVWVVKMPRSDKTTFPVKNQDSSGKFEYIAIPAEMGQIPREEVALVDTTEIFWFESVRKHARIEIIHVFVNW